MPKDNGNSNSRHPDPETGTAHEVKNGMTIIEKAKKATMHDIVKTVVILKKWLASADHEEDAETKAIIDDKESQSFAQKWMITESSVVNAKENKDTAPDVNFTTKSVIHDKIKRALTSTINANGSKYYYWTALVSVCCLYNISMIITRTTLTKLQRYFTLLWLVLDYLSDAVYLIDTNVQARRGFLKDGIIETDFKERLKMYIKSKHFWMDMISIFPTDLSYIFLGINQPLVRINRIFRGYRLNDFSDRTETRTNWPIAFRVLKMFLVIFIVFHWNASIYFLLSLYFGPISDAGNYTDRWVFSFDRIMDTIIPCVDYIVGTNITWYSNTSTCQSPYYEVNFSPLTKEYLFSFYWSALTLTKLGEQLPPQTEGEFLFVIFDIILGLLILAAIVGSVSTMVVSMNLKNTQFTEILDGVKQYMVYRKVDPGLQKRVVKWFSYIWNEREGALEEEAAIVSLPAKIKAELAIQVHMETLKRVRIFQDCEPGLLIELVLQLRLQVFSPGDFICRKGDIGKEMYIVKRGSLNVVAEDGVTVFVTLKEGSVFGELSILDVPGNKNGNRRTASVRSVGYSDLFVLSKDQLWESLREYPDAKKLMLAKGREILQKDGLIDTTIPADAQVYVGKTVTERLERIKVSMHELEKTLDGFYQQFDEDTAEMKKRITNLEKVFKDHKKEIQQDCLLGRFNVNQDHI